MQPQSASNGTRGASGVNDAGWQLVIHKLVFDRVSAQFDDRVPETPVKLTIADAKVVADNLSNARNAKGRIDVSARVGTAGRMHVTGALATNPLAGDWRIDASRLDLVPLRPYFEARTNVGGDGGVVHRVVPVEEQVVVVEQILLHLSRGVSAEQIFQLLGILLAPGEVGLEDRFDRLLRVLTARVDGDAGRFAREADVSLVELEVGAAEVEDNDYFGQPLNRVARLLSTGHGPHELQPIAM